MPVKNQNGKPLNSIVEISKIYNTNLREYWLKELEMVKKCNNNSDMEYTRLLWHGTSHTHPQKIYNSSKGWKLNYAGEGNLWGKGLYFSQDAIYSSGKYAFFKTPQGTQLLLLADVILGSSTYLQESKETKKLKDAPLNPLSNNPFDSVIGNRHGTWIFVTYESSRAYPVYLVEYKPNK